MRLFAAVELPEPLRRAIAERVAAVRAGLPSAAWVKSENLHVTLVFFGELEGARVDRLTAALSGAAEPFGRLDLRLSGAGAFPPRGRVRVVWLGVEPAGGLDDLAGRLRHAAREAGFSFDDKPFSAHLTVARCRRPWPSTSRAELPALAPRAAGEFAVRSVALLASELAPGGPRYRRIARLPLEAAA